MAWGGKARRKRKAKKQSNMAMLAALAERAAPVAADARERRKKKEPREPRNAPSGDPQANEGEAATDPATALLSAATAYRRTEDVESFAGAMVSLGALIVLAAEDTMWDGLLIAKLLFAADARAVAWAEKAGAQAEEIGNVNKLINEMIACPDFKEDAEASLLWLLYELIERLHAHPPHIIVQGSLYLACLLNQIAHHARQGRSFASHRDPTTEHVRAAVALISQIEDLMKKHTDTMPDPQVKARTELLFGLVRDLEHIDQETAAAAWAYASTSSTPEESYEAVCTRFSNAYTQEREAQVICSREILEEESDEEDFFSWPTSDEEEEEIQETSNSAPPTAVYADDHHFGVAALRGDTAPTASDPPPAPTYFSSAVEEMKAQRDNALERELILGRKVKELEMALSAMTEQLTLLGELRPDMRSEQGKALSLKPTRTRSTHTQTAATVASPPPIPHYPYAVTTPAARGPSSRTALSPNFSPMSSPAEGISVRDAKGGSRRPRRVD
jgi:hypothetical protein